MADKPSEDQSGLCDLILNNPLNRDTVEELLEQVRKPAGVLPFVGAGLSVPLGLPGWTRFLLDGAGECGNTEVIEANINDGKFEEAAQTLSAALGWALFERRLEGAFHKKLPQNIAADLAVVQVPGLTNGPVITTNFDRALEEVFRAAGRPFTDVVWGNTADRLTAALREDSRVRVLLKMHGDVLDRQGRVLTFTEYEAHYGAGPDIDWDRPLPNSLRRVFENRPTLFLGCSLQSDRTLSVVKEVSRNTGLLHFAMLEAPLDAQVTRRKYLSDHGILSVFFPHGRFETLAPFLAHLCRLRSTANERGGGSEQVAGAGKKEPRESPPGKPPGPGAAPPKRDLQQNDSWSDRDWHHHVHQHLHEKLSYYLVRVRPFLRQQALAALERLVTEDELGTVRAFNLFGTYDLLLWAWLPGDYQHNFEQRLSACFTGLEGVQTFAVTEVVARWYQDATLPASGRERSPLLSDLDERVIDDLQCGLRPQFFQELCDARLIVETEQTSHRPIIFFTLINFERDLNLQAKANAANRLAQYFTSHPGLRRVFVDRCHGICEFLVKAEADDYFTITEIPDWISRTFISEKATTETYLSKAPSHIYGSGKIGGATFGALGGRDLFVSNLIPAVYPRRAPIHYEVETFVKNTPILRELGPGGRKLSRGFLTGVLRHRKMDSSAVLFELFGEIEDYLRGTHREFLGRRGKNPNTIYEETRVPDERWRQLNLMDLLQICSRAIADHHQGPEIGFDWKGLTDVRNAAIHNKPESEVWQSMLRPVLEYWMKLNALILLVESTTGNVFHGTYREEADKIKFGKP